MWDKSLWEHAGSEISPKSWRKWNLGTRIWSEKRYCLIHSFRLRSWTWTYSSQSSPSEPKGKLGALCCKIEPIDQSVPSHLETYHSAPFDLSHYAPFPVHIQSSTAQISLPTSRSLSSAEKFQRWLLKGQLDLPSSLCHLWPSQERSLSITIIILIFLRTKLYISLGSTSLTKEPDSRWKTQTVSP